MSGKYQNQKRKGEKKLNLTLSYIQKAQKQQNQLQLYHQQNEAKMNESKSIMNRNTSAQSRFESKSNQIKEKQIYIKQVLEQQKRVRERQQTFIGLNDKIVNLEKELEQKDLQIARKDQMMKGYTDRLAKNTEQINELRKHLRETSTKYKQLSTSVKNMKFHKQSEKQREITALGKVIKFYEQQRKPNETEEQLKNILQFSQNQQADIDVLLLKLMKKEQLYRNKEEVLEQQTKLEESATVFTAANCDRIEQSLKNSVEFQSKICDRIVQIIEENDYLRKKVEQMNVLIERSTKTQSKIKGYEQTLQGMVLKCSAWLQNEPQQRVRQLNQKTTQIMEMQSRLKSKEYQMRKDKQQMLKMQSTIKVLQAKCKQQQLQLMNHTKENQSHNFIEIKAMNKKDEQINQLKQRILDQSALNLKKQTQLQSKNNQLVKQIQKTQQQFISFKAKSQEEILNYKTQNSRLSQRQLNLEQIIEKKNHEIKVLEKITMDQETQLEKLNKNKESEEYRLFAPQTILQINVREQLKGQIEKLTSKNIKRTQLVYRQDQINHNFGSYLTQDFPILLVIRISQNKLFGGFSYHFRLENKQFSPSFLFSLDKGQLNFYMKNEKVRQSSRPCTYTDNYLVFGNNEAYLHNNSKSYELTLNLHIFGERYFNINSKKLGFDGVIKDNKVRYLKMEIYRVILI